MSTLTILTLVAALIVFLPAFWCAIVVVLSHVSGWQKLAKSYGAHSSPHGRRFTGQSGKVGVVSYRNTITVCVAPEGLFLSLPVLIRVGHKPLFITWSAISNQKPMKILWYSAIRFQVGSPAVADMELPVGLFEDHDATRQESL